MTRSLTGLLNILLGFILFSCVSAKKPDDDRSLLWKISGKNLNKPSYLFGTIHLICPDDYLWTEKMQQSLDKADEVCFEMDMDDPSVMMTVAMGMVDQSGKKLEEYFAPEDYKKISDYVRDSLNMNITMFQNMKPSALPTIFAVRSVYCADPVSYEDRIMQKAQKSKKEIVGIEMPEEQIALFNSIPVDSVIKEVIDVINNERKDEDTYRAMIKAYKEQDLQALYNFIKESENIGAEVGPFLDDRNKKWIERMVERMDQKSVFFAVGAGHLWGDNGVISLLRKDGYTVEPVK